MEATDQGGKTGHGRAEIDTRPPFRSVRDAVSLFGQGVFPGDTDSRRLKQTIPRGGPELKSITMELEETKESLEKAREETELMATQMSSLMKELDNTKRELQQLKEIRDSEMEELKFVKDSPNSEEEEEEEEENELEKKRYVTFSHPTLSQIILPDRNPSPALLERNSSIKKDKNKKKSFTLLPLFGGIFPKRKTKYDV